MPTSRPHLRSEESKDEDEGTRDEKIQEKRSENSWETIRVDGFAYRVQMVPPGFRDRAVGDQRGRTLKTKLMVFLITILVVAALVGVIGKLLQK